MDIGYSVLMSVYAKESPDFLRQSMESIYDQTIPTDDFVLICDGPLNEGLDAVIDEMQNKFGPRLRVFRQSENHGLGYCLNLGVKECKNDLIARMDSDDVSVKDRCERELKFLNEHSEISVVGSIVAEFEHDLTKPYALRKVPETHKEILKFLRMRSPINHPSIMLRKKDVLASGNYPVVHYCEDYNLWGKMLAKGYQFYNIQEPLVYMREDRKTFLRRGGIKYFMAQRQIFRQMRNDGLTTNFWYHSAMILRFSSAIAPNWLRQALFSRFMRKGIK